MVNLIPIEINYIIKLLNIESNIRALVR